MGYFTIAILCAVIGYLGTMNYLDRRAAHAREKDLLDRVMARNLPDYAHSQALSRTVFRRDDRPTDTERDMAYQELQARGWVQPDNVPVD